VVPKSAGKYLRRAKESSLAVPACWEPWIAAVPSRGFAQRDLKSTRAGSGTVGCRAAAHRGSGLLSTPAPMLGC
jgi:hypothetical protein